MTSAQTKPHQDTLTVPFKGCASFGQTEVLDAPKGTSKSVSVSADNARMLEYYASANGIKILAPRGWYCYGTSGSSGAGLWLGPGPIVYTSSGPQGLSGAVIEYNLVSDENSGRYQIAEVIARVFPAYLTFAHQIWDGLDEPFPAGPFAKDSLRRKSGTVVEFMTPAQTDGLGNFDSYIGKNDYPISGVALLGIHPPDPSRHITYLAILSVRLPPGLRNLTPAIIHYAENLGPPR